jgi:Tat protein translocase TatB subunit
VPTSLGPAEIIVILVVALIVLGPNRLPEAGRQVGKALAEVRRWSQGFKSEVQNVLDTDPSPKKKPVINTTTVAEPGRADAGLAEAGPTDGGSTDGGSTAGRPAEAGPAPSEPPADSTST